MRSAPPRHPHADLVAARLTWGTLRGSTPDTEELDLLRRGLGGLVLFSRSLGDRGAVRALVARVRAESPAGLHVSVDQEGGHIVRLREGFTAFPGAMAIGATGSEELAFEAARASARELAEVGIDTVLAPVLDLAADLRNPTIGSRAYGADPALVARLGAAAIRGYLAGGVIPVPKHFPGHGRTPLDSHLAAPVVRGSRADLQRDLEPFRGAVAAGAPMLMASHLRYDAVGDDLPASLSAAVVRLAREELGFRGVLVTDAMVMDAITAGGPVPDACLAALVAGCDVAMALEPSRRTIELVAAALLDGRLSAGRAEMALARLAPLAAAGPTGGERIVGERDVERDVEDGRDHGGIGAEIARRSLTLVRDTGLLPIAVSTSIVLIDVGGRALSPVEDSASGARSAVATALAARFSRLAICDVTPDDEAGARAAIEAAGGAEIVIVATRDAFVRPFERRLLARVAEVGRPVLRVALRSPEDLAIAPLPDAAVAAYCEVSPTVAALAAALATGRRAFPGRLPVELRLESGADLEFPAERDARGATPPGGR
jgi:beta-N-acetylhexosaminidase